jgi:hypothetical protein
MVLTILAIPFLVLGVFISPYTLASARCLAIGSVSNGGYCFEPGSHLPEAIKYGCVLLGFALLYAGRRQIKRARGSN